MNLKKALRNIFMDEGETTLWQCLKSWLSIIAGCLCVAIGFAVFINPYNLVPGGIFGLSIVLHNLFPSIQVGYFGYMLDVPLMILSFLLLGSTFGFRTIAAVLLTPFMMNMIEVVAYPDAASLQELNPAVMFGGAVDLSQHLLLTAIIGGGMVGLGCGLVVRGGATSGGTDVIGMIMHKYIHIPFSNAVLMCDATVVLLGLVVIGFGLGLESGPESASWLLSLYSLIAAIVLSRTIAFVISGSAREKIIFVISDGNMEMLHDYVLNKIDRGGTVIRTKGLYSGKERDMLFLVVDRRQVMGVKQNIKLADPNAFVVVTDAYDTYGEGFKNLPSPNEINPE